MHKLNPESSKTDKMKRQKPTISFYDMDVELSTYDTLMSWVALYQESTKEPKLPGQDLGGGFHLVPIELKNNKGEVIENRIGYSHLYREGELVLSAVFRKGGLDGNFKDGYCELIHYTDQRSDGSFLTTEWVIINEEGHFCLRADSTIDHPHHLGGRIACKKNLIFDLKTGQAIAPKCHEYINGKGFYIIEHRYNFHYMTNDVELEPGVYRINKYTAEIDRIDDIK